MEQSHQAASTLACFRLSISGSERKQRRAKKASESRRESGSEEAPFPPSPLLRPSLCLPRSPSARRMDPLTEGLEQATSTLQQKELEEHYRGLVAIGV